MNCFFASNHLTAYLGGQVPPLLREQIKEHLDSCPSCLQNMDELKVLVRNLNQLPAKNFESSIRGRIRCHLAKSKPNLPWFHHFIFPPKMMVAIALTTLFFLTLNVYYQYRFYVEERLKAQKTIESFAQKVESEKKSEKKDIRVAQVAKAKVAPPSSEGKAIPPLTPPPVQRPTPKQFAAKPLNPNPPVKPVESSSPSPVTFQKTKASTEPLSQPISQPAEMSPSPTQELAQTPRVALQWVLETDSYNITRKKVIKTCKSLGCKTDIGNRSIYFVDDEFVEGKTLIRFQLSALHFDALKNRLADFGRLIIDDTSLGIGQGEQEEGNLLSFQLTVQEVEEN